MVTANRRHLRKKTVKMKRARILLGSFCCLMLVFNSLSDKEGENELGKFLDGHSPRSATFIENRHHYLDMQLILHTEFVSNSIQCAMNCLVTVRCRSFNFRLQADIDGKHICELLASDKFNSSERYVLNKEFHHYSIVVRLLIFWYFFMIYR